MILIIGLILLGILLLILEILVLPGMIAGIVGGIFIAFGIFKSYSDYGSSTGNLTFLSAVATTFLAIYFSLKTRAWNRYGLKGAIDSRVNDVSTLPVKEGDEGKALSALRPSGTVYVNNARLEAQTSGEMIDAGSKIVITRVLPNKVIVKLKVSEL